MLRKKRGPSVSGKVHDPESVGKKRGSEQSDRYRKSAAPSRMIVTEKARLRALRERRTIPSPSGKSTAPSRMIVTEKARFRALRKRRTIPSPSGKSTAQSASGKAHDPESVGKKRGSEQSDRYRKSTAQSIPVKVHSSEYFGKDKNLNRSAASRAVYKENLDRERERYIFLYRQEKYS